MYFVYAYACQHKFERQLFAKAFYAPKYKIKFVITTHKYLKMIYFKNCFLKLVFKNISLKSNLKQNLK